MSELHPVTFCVADLNTIKHVALFYDTVMPFPFEALPDSLPDVMTSEQVVTDIWKFIPEQCYEHLVGPIAYVMHRPDKLGAVGHEIRARILALLLLMHSFGFDIKNKSGFTGKNIENALDGLALKEYGIEPIIVLPEETLRSDTAESDDFSVTLGNLKLIDTGAASWDQIMEVRKDEEARKKLRNLRLFLQTNYAGKSKSFVEDDLAKRLDDYRNVAKDYGFETLTSALMVIANSDSLIAFGTASLAALLLGEPMLASASLVVGASVEVAKVTLEVVNKRHAFRKFKRDHDLAYIFDIRKTLSDTRANK